MDNLIIDINIVIGTRALGCPSLSDIQSLNCFAYDMYGYSSL